jgi:hypothetical protein
MERRCIQICRTLQKSRGEVINPIKFPILSIFLKVESIYCLPFGFPPHRGMAEYSERKVKKRA